MRARYHVAHPVTPRTRVQVYGRDGGCKEQDRQQMALEACLLPGGLPLVVGEVIAMHLPSLLPRQRHQFEW